MNPSSSQGRGRLLAVMRHRDFAWFIVAAAVSNGGAWMQNIAVPALLFDLTDSATWLGISAMAMLLPAMLITPFAGVLADRVSRRKLLIATQSVMMAAATVLWLLYRADALTPFRIVGLGLVTGISSGFQAATWQSFIPLLVPVEHMLEAVRLNSLQFTLARAIGPGLAGVVLATWGTGAAIFVNVITFPLVLGVLMIVSPRAASTGAATGRVRDALRAGGAYVWRHGPTRLAVTLAFVTAMLGQPPQHVGAAVAARVFGRPSKDFALLLATLGIGALCGSGVISRLIDRIAKSRVMLLSLVLYFVGLALLAATTDFRVGLAAYFVSGIGHLTGAMSLNTVVQGSVPEDLRGRVVSFYVLGVLAGIPLGSFALGRLADTIGMRNALGIFAALLGTFSVFLVVRGSLRCFDLAAPDEAVEIAH